MALTASVPHFTYVIGYRHPTRNKTFPTSVILLYSIKIMYLGTVVCYSATYFHT